MLISSHFRAIWLANKIIDSFPTGIEFKQQFIQLKNQLPKINKNFTFKIFLAWWEINGKAWTQQLRELVIPYRQIGYDWQFSKPQQELLRQYYDANKLLVDCLYSFSLVSGRVKRKIENDLFFPITKIRED